MNVKLSINHLKESAKPWSIQYILLLNCVLFLFFIQAIRNFIPPIYVAITHVVFGEDVITNLLMILNMFLILLPVLTLTIVKRTDKEILLKISAILISILRILISLQLSAAAMALFSGLLIAFYGIYLSTFLAIWVNGTDEVESSNKVIVFFLSVVGAFLIDYMIRTIGFTQDISLTTPALIAEYWYITQYLWLIIQIPLSLAVIFMTIKFFPSLSVEEYKSEKKDHHSSLISLIFSGIGMFLFLQFTIFLYPNAIAQHTGTDYSINTILNILAVSSLIPLFYLVDKKFWSNYVIIGILNAILILSYILFFAEANLPFYLTSILMSTSLIIMYIDFFLLIVGLVNTKTKWEPIKTYSNAITIGLLFYLIFTVLHILTTEWATTVAALKGMGPIVIIIAGIVLALTTLTSIMVTKKNGGAPK